MSWLTKLIAGMLAKLATLWVVFTAGRNKQKLERAKHENKIHKKAADIRVQVNGTPVTDLREWLRKRSKRS